MTIDRRSFLASTAGLPALLLPKGAVAQAGRRGPIAISSANTLAAVARAVEVLGDGGDPADAVVAGVTLVENDPNDMSVGLGGLPNEDGVVQLDASVMHGPTHKAGAVAGLEDVRNAAQVALLVLRRTDHVMLVGRGAKKFALRHGFTEENLLTDKAREAWLRWKRNLNPNDDWLDDDQRLDGPERDAAPIPHTHGTIHCAALDAGGDLAACTTTSGLSYKIDGRVGDSPIVGAGMFVDNEVGAAGATGRGESLIQSAGAARIVQRMADGDDPTAACLHCLKWIADHTKRRSLLNDRGEPNFGCVVYALRKDGAYGSASMHKGYRFAVHDGVEARFERCRSLFGG
ncbi:MAG: N(4)-(beta-N-acetylglucosaminyl)-L-asparaginase [Planctomycetes bacterium]|nr:N(4)-(beta-N-acetylglucosaminyl)-L-asparaginase [Planctomycetota bacterium]